MTRNSRRTTSPIIFVFLTILLLQVWASIPTATSFPRHASDQVGGTPAQLTLSAGVSPATLVPVSQGVPVFTSGESLWLMANSNYSSLFVSLYSPSGSDVASTTLPNGTVASIYRFQSVDPRGVWNLTVSANGTVYNYPVSFAELSGIGSESYVSDYSLQNANLLVKFGINSTSAYDIEACITNGQSSPTISFPVPSSVGSGQVNLTETSENSTSVLYSNGGNTAPFTFWYEIRYPYSFAYPTQLHLVTKDVTASTSDSTVLTTASRQVLGATNLVDRRPGRIVVDAYFRNGRGLQVQETRAYDFGNGTWFWLNSCQTLSEYPGRFFTSVTDLSVGNPEWPTTLITMFRENGLESDSILSFNPEAAKVSFVAQPWNIQTGDIGVSLSPSSSLLASSISNNTAYIIEKGYPATLGYSLTYGGKVFTSGTYAVQRPESSYQVSVPTGRISAQVINGGNPVAGATVSIRNLNLNVSGVSRSTDATGTVVFYLPPGNYTVSATQGSSSESQSLPVLINQNVPLTFDFTPPTPTQTYLPYVVVIAILGLVANIWVWLVKPRLALRRLTRS